MSVKYAIGANSYFFTNIYIVWYIDYGIITNMGVSFNGKFTIVSILTRKDGAIGRNLYIVFKTPDWVNI